MKNSVAVANEKKYREYVLNKIDEYNANGKITVATFCDAFFPSVDGVVKVLDNVVKRIDGRVNVVVFAPQHLGETVKRDYLVIGLKSTYFKNLNYDTCLNYDSFLGKVFKRLRVDIVHTHSPFSLGKKARKLSELKKVPLVSTFHSQYKKDILKQTKSRILTKFVLAYIMRVFNHSTEVWTMHDKSAETIRSYGYKGKIKLVPNATDFVYPADAERRKEQFKKRYDIKDGETVFAFVGRLVTQKNILFIAEVLGKLKARGVQFKTFFVGDGPDRGKLEDKLAKCGVTDRCVMVGALNNISDVENYYLCADLMLFPSKYDVSSIVQIEAASMRTPCAFVEGSVTSCTVEGGRNGYIFPDDVEKFADGVEKAVKDRATLGRISQAAYDELYVTWDGVAKMTEERYLELIKESKKDVRK